ncbi:LolA family protein [Natrialbaceae archaeon AArc-T1-2]|uniref:LolA family protein n=1 Tax=Natrialbaceae archaeon AArc-T1-2 TaxID=3053904 RepID=UPI00255A9FAE|nr:DUF2092 domain-containing protein [Natrialbaceae archaeon AArc-T1-2]WIV67699.1 DUF2092 domain-containing protein [Natrialbaceae archaeon AArc-T1-2]
MVSNRLVASVCVLAFVAVLGGCVALEPPTSDEPDHKALFEQAFVHGDDLEAVYGERVTEATDGEETATTVHAVAERPYVEYRSEVLESDDPDRVGDVYVSNATTTWWYDPDTNVTERFVTEEPFENEDVRTARADEADRQLELVDLEYRGTDVVAGREAHVLEIEAKAEAVERGVSVLVGDTEFVYALETADPADELVVTEQTVWIDAEYGYPLQERLVVDGDEEYVLTERFETVTFTDDLADDTFVFEPPEDAEVVTLSE